MMKFDVCDSAFVWQKTSRKIHRKRNVMKATLTLTRPKGLWCPHSWFQVKWLTFLEAIYPLTSFDLHGKSCSQSQKDLLQFEALVIGLFETCLHLKRLNVDCVHTSNPRREDANNIFGKLYVSEPSYSFEYILQQSFVHSCSWICCGSLSFIIRNCMTFWRSMREHIWMS